METIVKYGVSQTPNGSFVPVIFINNQTSSYSMISRKTAKGALKLAEKWVDEIVQRMYYKDKVIVIKWQHSVI